MQTNIFSYLEKLKDSVKKEISSLLTDESVVWVTRVSFEDYFRNIKLSAFHNYYSETVSNKELFLSDPSFFSRFKQQYSLQGVDSSYLKLLEENKPEIIELIQSGDLSLLYFKFFANAQIKHGEETKQKSLGSFFAKLVHTFAPNDFCALDNPIKDYFGLKKESFYIAFVVISQAYKEWSIENDGIINKIKMELERFAKDISPNSDMTDLKLLDLIFWYQANRKEAQ